MVYLEQMAKRRKSKKGKAKGGTGVVSAAVIVEPGSGQKSYAMFEVSKVSGEEAILRGPLLLEPGEPITLELAFSDGSTLQVPAAVEESIRDDSRMRVRFERPDDRESIEKKLR